MSKLYTHQIPLDRVIVYVVNTDDVGGDEHWLLIFFLDLFEFLESVAVPLGNSPVQIFSNHLFHGKYFFKVFMFSIVTHNSYI